VFLVDVMANKSMGALAATISETYTQRYEALLRATSAIGTCSDCDAAADMLLKTLLEVVPFDYLQLIAFQSDSKTVGWHLLYSKGRKHDVPEADVVLEDTPIASVHESQQALVTADWRAEARFAKHGEFLSELGIASTCVLPLTRGERRLGALSFGSTHPHAYPEE
jgi:transcriptional regulator with GAF, ATPase, and Fis domain